MCICSLSVYTVVCSSVIGHDEELYHAQRIELSAANWESSWKPGGEELLNTYNIDDCIIFLQEPQQAKTMMSTE